MRLKIVQHFGFYYNLLLMCSLLALIRYYTEGFHLRTNNNHANMFVFVSHDADDRDISQRPKWIFRNACASNYHDYYKIATCVKL